MTKAGCPLNIQGNISHNAADLSEQKQCNLVNECDDARLSDECQEALGTMLAKSSSRLETCLVEEVLWAIDGERSRFRANSKASVLMRLLEDFMDDSPYDPKCLESLSTFTREVLVKDSELWNKICGLSDYAKDIYDKLKTSPFTYAVLEYNSSLVEAVHYLQTAFREKQISKKSVYYGLLEELVSYSTDVPYDENTAASAELRDVMRRFHQAVLFTAGTSSVSTPPCEDFPEVPPPSMNPLPKVEKAVGKVSMKAASGDKSRRPPSTYIIFCND